MRLLPTAILAWLFFGAIGTLSGVWAVLSIGRGEFLTAIATAGVSAFCFGLVIPLVKVVRETVTPRAAFDRTGTIFRPDRGIDVPIQISVLGLVVACALIAILAPLGKLDISLSPFMRLSLPFVSALIVVTGVPMLWRNLRRGSTKYLRLTPDGFALSQGWRYQSDDWSQVVDVTKEVPGQSAPTPAAIVVVMSDGSTATIAGASFTPEGAAMRELVRFYWQHPDCRVELTDGRALKRLAEERFEAGS
jgi:hypothetical protein